MTDICEQPRASAGRVLLDLIRPGSSPALICPEDGLTLTHGDVAGLVTELGGRLCSAGVERATASRSFCRTVLRSCCVCSRSHCSVRSRDR